MLSKDIFVNFAKLYNKYLRTTFVNVGNKLHLHIYCGVAGVHNICDVVSVTKKPNMKPVQQRCTVWFQESSWSAFHTQRTGKESVTAQLFSHCSVY